MAALLTSLGISIHAPREGGDVIMHQSAREAYISIHAPREGGDHNQFHTCSKGQGISIHAPREGGDSKDAQFYL